MKKKFKCPACGRAYSCPTCGRAYKNAEEIVRLARAEKQEKCEKCKASLSVAVGAAMKKLARHGN